MAIRGEGRRDRRRYLAVLQVTARKAPESFARAGLGGSRTTVSHLFLKENAIKFIENRCQMGSRYIYMCIYVRAYLKEIWKHVSLISSYNYHLTSYNRKYTIVSSYVLTYYKYVI